MLKVFIPRGSQRGRKLPMRLTQCRPLARRITVITERLVYRFEQPGQVDVAEGAGAVREAGACLCRLRG